MFIDICYANGNEKEFLDYAREVNTLHLCFLGKKTYFNFNQPRIPKFLDFGSSVQKSYVYVIQNLDKDKKFNAPMKINHVYFKELKENNCVVAVSFNELLKNPVNYEKIKFIVKICKKYRVPLFIASFAKKPSEIRAKNALLAVGRMLLLEKDALENFGNFLAQDI